MDFFNCKNNIIEMFIIVKKKKIIETYYRNSVSLDFSFTDLKRPKCLIFSFNIISKVMILVSYD